MQRVRRVRRSVVVVWLLAAATWACSDSDSGSDGSGGSGGEPTKGYPTCSEIAAEAGDAVDALVADLAECEDDADCILAEVSPPSCSQRCPPVIAADQQEALSEGLAEISAEHCVGVVGACDWAAPSCLPAEPNCRDGRCVYTRGVEPGRCPSGEPPELPTDKECGDTTCGEAEFCCTTRGDRPFCAGPSSSCALDLCPAVDDGGADDLDGGS